MNLKNNFLFEVTSEEKKVTPKPRTDSVYYNKEEKFKNVTPEAERKAREFEKAAEEYNKERERLGKIKKREKAKKDRNKRLLITAIVTLAITVAACTTSKNANPNTVIGHNGEIFTIEDDVNSRGGR